MFLIVNVTSKPQPNSRASLQIRDAASEERASESCATKKTDTTLKKVKIFESLIHEDEWGAHTSNIDLGKYYFTLRVIARVTFNYQLNNINLPSG